ncbi:M23 family metallopeptidase [Cyanobium sp. ATX 6F1]|uniref:M23 family metallopeptidase n=1 Tax=Cyanobium sp. ATX 6F1 TaxID=2823702 RepID=UPI0020CC44B1|nr:M23 family metallopeptidase [Cyanobium sp. ATX 6F1]MCP9917679.1 M23 family metallopeptidase [Cyanobium sp. ATX 6F1]
MARPSARPLTLAALGGLLALGPAPIWAQPMPPPIAIPLPTIIRPTSRGAVAEATQAPPLWTPVVARALTPLAPAVPGVDGQRHLVYELELLNATRSPARLESLEVRDGTRPERVLASFTGPELLPRLRTLGNSAAADPVIPFDQARLVLINLSLPPGGPLPARLLHRLKVSGSTGPAPGKAGPVSYDAAPIAIEPQLFVLGPPLGGKGWVAINGCCRSDVGHRSTGLPIDGRLAFAQRFAIDWMRLDGQGRLANGDLSKVGSYPSFGAEVIAVADGTVVDVRNDLPEQVPPNLPAPSAVSLATVLGNHVILQVGPEAYAVYAHLQPGSVRVRAGERVRRGQPLGLLGNSGNSSAPHLHFHLMRGPSLGSDGLPYVIDQFQLAGQIPEAQADAFYGFKGAWNQTLLPTPAPRANQFPLFFSVLDFPTTPAP